MTPPNPEPLDYANPQHLRPADHAGSFPTLTKRSHKPSLWTTLILLLLLLLGGLLLLPSLSGSKPSPHLRAMVNLRQIGIYLEHYASTHAGHLPDSWETLLNSTSSAQEAQALARLLAGDRTGIAPAEGTTTQQIVNDFRSGGHCEYLYFGKGTTLASMNSDSIVAFELTPTGRNRAHVVLSGDLRAVVMPFSQVMNKIQDSISKLSAGPSTQSGN